MMINLWKRQWKKAGFLPRVLSLDDVCYHRQFGPLSKKADQWPSVNNKLYEYYCFIRWCCSHILVPGEIVLFADYDVFPNAGFDFTPRQVTADFGTHGLICGHHDGGPGIWAADAAGLNHLVQCMVNYEIEDSDRHPLEDLVNGVPNIQDMHILRKRAKCHRLNWVRNYKDPLDGPGEWERSPCFHLANNFRQKSWMPKWLEATLVLGLQFDPAVPV